VPSNERLILASASTARAALLAGAGLDFTIVPSAFDEDAVKREALRRGDSPVTCVELLAVAKASAVSRLHPGALVIGADQLLATDTCWFDKPRDLEAARGQLRLLRGRTHQLATAACVVRAGRTLWQAHSLPELTMRDFSDSFVETYVAAEGDALLGSVGSYRLEGRGVQLFERISGDYFAILGLPLVELLGFLRDRKVLAR